MDKSDNSIEDIFKTSQSLHIDEVRLILYILEDAILKLSFFRARREQINGRFDLRFLRDSDPIGSGSELHMVRKRQLLILSCETYLPPYKPISRKEVDLRDWKLAWDLSLLQKTLTICRDELSKAGTHSTLQQYVLRKQDLQQDEKKCLRQVKQPPSYKIQAYNKEDEEEEKFEKLKTQQKKLIDQYEETAYRCKSIRTYFENYHKTRIDQTKYKMKHNEEVMRRKMFQTIKDEDNEKKAHDRIMVFLREALKRLDEKLEYWTEERRKDVAWREEEIKNVKAELQEVTRTKQELYEDYDRREEEMRAYLVERAARREREAAEEAQRACVVRIQAWWRGCMVRFSLGPFSPDHLRRKKKKCKKK